MIRSALCLFFFIWGLQYLFAYHTPLPQLFENTDNSLWNFHGYYLLLEVSCRFGWHLVSWVWTTFELLWLEHFSAVGVKNEGGAECNVTKLPIQASREKIFTWWLLLIHSISPPQGLEQKKFSLRISVEIIQKMQVLPGEEFLSPQPWCSSVRLWAVSVKKGVEYPLLGWISQQGGGNREYHLRPM